MGVIDAIGELLVVLMVLSVMATVIEALLVAAAFYVFVKWAGKEE